ncbi:MAG: hypothetical protein NC311_10750 [Muribaculaceae bacterium]|nr:hypothetical protein [Muribaculaceae bacterium]
MIKEIRLFPWQHNPILPTVFNDSLTEIENIGAMVHKLNELIEDYNEFIAHYKEYIASQLEPFDVRLTAAENRINGLIDVVNSEIADLEMRVDAKIYQLNEDVQNNIAANQQYVDERVDEMQDMLEQQHQYFDKKIADLNDFIDDVVQRIKTDMTCLVSAQVAELRNLIDIHDDYVKQWVNARLSDFIEELPTKELFVVNPVTGYTDTLQQTLWDLYDFYRDEALTAREYDDLELTALEYDSKGLTAWEYDGYGRRILMTDERYRMFNPFTGQYELIKYVVDDLCDLHKEGTVLTADGYDMLELTAQAYDDNNLTAYDYDWKGKLLLAA